MTLGAIRVRYALPLAVAGAIATWAALLYLTRRFDFYFDEWDFVLGAPYWTVGSYFEPHNEHWSTVPMLVYKLLFTLFGARTYVPFMATVLALHASAAVLLFVLIRGRAGDLPGLAAAALLLMLGTGFENILWAFQIGFLGSIDLGLLAILMLEPPALGAGRVAVAGLCLLLATMSSGVGLFFVAAVVADLALSAQRRWALIAALPAIAAYLLWSETAGRHSLSATRGTSPFSLTAILSLRTYVPYGIGRAFAALLGGVATEWHLLGFGGLVAILVLTLALRGPRLDSRVAGAAFGLFVMFAATGLVRSELGDFQAGSPRYVYNAAIFLLPILAWVVAPLPWRRAVAAPLTLLLVYSIAINGYVLVRAAHAKNDLFALQDRELEAAWIVRRAPGVDENAVVDPTLMPQVTLGRYVDARSHLGTNLPEPSTLGALPTSAVDPVLTRLLPPRLSEEQDFGPEPCKTAQPLEAASVAPGTGLDVRSDVPGRVAIYAWYAGPGPLGTPTVETDLAPHEMLRIQMPDTGQPGTWHLKVVLPPYSNGSACASGR